MGLLAWTVWLASGLACLLLLKQAQNMVKKKKKTNLFMESLERKHVVVTGASSGIGEAIARQALQAGAFVTIISRNTSKLDATAHKLALQTQCSPDKIRHQVADVREHSEITGAIREALRWKPIDVLVCNAGLTRGGYMGDAEVADLDTVIDTNLKGTVYPIHEALPFLKQHSLDHPVSIVIIASIASLFYLYGHAVYTATKYAVRGLAEGLRAELIPYNVKVTVMCPGFTNTPFLEDVNKEGELAEIVKKVNLYDVKKTETPESVASQTMEAIKQGRFIVVTQPIGIQLLALSRGLMPAENPLTALIETALLLPVRLLSFTYARNIKNLILEEANKPVKMRMGHMLHES